MQIKEVQFDPKRILGPADQSGAVRSAGLHISRIYGDLESYFRKKNDLTPDELSFYAAGGFMWEHIFNVALQTSLQSDYIVRPGEMMCDNIIGSPDLWNLQDNRVIETKATWRSARKLDSLEKFFWPWLVQMKGYCRMMGTQEADLHVLFVNGYYTPPRPCVRSLELRWTQHEILENWSMLLAHAKRKGWL